MQNVLTPRLRHNPRLRPKFWRHDWYTLISLRRGIETALLTLPRTGIAVDVGAGAAPYRSLFTRRGLRYVRCDIEGEAEVLIVPGEPIDWPAASADLVVSFQVLEHVWDLDWYLGECRRLLKTDGRLLISTHGTWLYHPHPTDFRRWTRDGLVKELETRGFEVESVKAMLGPLSWTTQFRALGYHQILRRLGAPGHILSALVCALLNARMVAEDKLTPDSIRDFNAAGLLDYRQTFAMNPYRQRVWKIIEEMMPKTAPLENALDFGSGDGWFARQMQNSGRIEDLTAIDIKRRDTVLFEPTIYDGAVLPYQPRQFDLVYSIDVLHHCPDPAAQLREILGCSRRYFLLKDHNYRTPIGKWELAILDEIGNRKFGIPSLYQYQKRWQWFDIARAEGFELRKLVYPAPVHVGALGVLTNALQFVALWERV